MLPALIEGPYNASASSDRPTACDTVLAFARGISITGIIGRLNRYVEGRNPENLSTGDTWPRLKAMRFILVWMVASSAEVEALPRFPNEAIIVATHVELRIVCGEKGDTRINFGTEIKKEQTEGSSRTSAGVLVCGPAPIADEIRSEVNKADSAGFGRLELCVETFGW